MLHMIYKQLVIPIVPIIPIPTMTIRPRKVFASRHELL